MKYLKYWRLVRGKTQAKVADDAGISQGHYCDIEKRGKTPRPEYYKPLAEALNRPVEELVGVLHGVVKFNPEDHIPRHGSAAR